MPSSKRRILIVDDDSDTREVLELALSLENYHVEIAADEDHAIRALSQLRPDIILLDFNLNGTTPGKFMAEFRQRQCSAQIVLITADKNCAERAAELGIDYCLPKPFDLDALMNLLKNMNPAQVH